MVDALNRLDQTDALVGQILGDRAKLEHHANRGHCAFKQPMRCWRILTEAETTTSSESNHHHHYNHKASSDTESEQLDWGSRKN